MASPTKLLNNFLPAYKFLRIGAGGDVAIGRLWAYLMFRDGFSTALEVGMPGHILEYSLRAFAWETVLRFLS